MPVIKIRRGTTTQWNASSRVLQVGELGIDTTLNRIKAGNGTNVWSALPYLSLSSAEIEELSQDAVSTALASGTHSNITVTYSDNGNSISLATGPDVITQTSLSNTLTNPTTGYVAIGDVGQADGVASLDSGGKVPDSEIPTAIARLASPTFTGTPAAPTATAGTNTTQVATTAFVGTAVSNLVNAAPESLNTLKELSDALGADANYASTITTALGTKEPLLPSQSGNSGKYLTTNGSAKSWATIPVTSESTTTALGTVYGKTSGSNYAIGQNLYPNLSTGTSNIAIGGASMYAIQGGNGNIAIGESSFAGLANMDYNVGIGLNVMFNAGPAGGGHNVAIGSSAGSAATVEVYNNVLIGSSAGGGVGVSGAMISGTNNILIGYQSIPSATSISNEITLGNSNITKFRIPGLAINWSTSAYGRATYASTSAPSGGADGDVWLVYTP